MKRDVEVRVETWPMSERFEIAGMVYDEVQALFVSVEQDGVTGRGEAAGVDYLADTPAGAARLIAENIRAIETCADRDALAALLPAGGALNALDCAFWDLELKLQGRTIWSALGMEPRPVDTVATVGIGDIDWMADRARRYADVPNLKIKLDGRQPVERVAAVRAARPDARIVVDANRGWTVRELTEHAPRLAELGVMMIEQPVQPEFDLQVEPGMSPVPLCADESCQTLADLDRLQGHYSMINIKLDKCGGLTAALRLAREARDRGFGLMVGNMLGTSLAMAPAFVIAQLCDFADLDGPLLLARDRDHPLRFDNGRVAVPDGRLWG